MKTKDIIGAIMALVIVCLFYSIIDSAALGVGCKLKAMGEDELYCKNVDVSQSNATRDSRYRWKLFNSTQDKIDQKNRDDAYRQRKALKKYQQECYDNGTDYSYSYDITQDYNFTCNQIEYINDHFIDNVQQMDGGYIKGSYKGFLSRGSVEGKSYEYVVTRVLATGMLMEEYSYRLDCEDNKVDVVENFYDESEFVMYYVVECIEG